MSKPVDARELSPKLFESAKRKGAEYADIRFEEHAHESLTVENGAVSAIRTGHTGGVGIRVRMRGAWGFAATPVASPKTLNATLDTALALAKAAAGFIRKPLALPSLGPRQAVHRSRYDVDPFAVPLDKKLDYLLWANHALMGPDAIRHATTHMDFYKRDKLFLSSEGADIEQHILESSAGLEVVAQAGGEVQSRSFPNSHHGALAQAGFEYVKQLDLVGGAATAQREVLELLRADSPRPGKTTLVLHPTQVVMQLHESCGHPTELDRVLGHEMSYAGGSFLTPDQLGKLDYGSRHVNIVADATVAGGVGSFAYDDEGVPAQRVELVRRGKFLGYLSSRESAATLGLAASGGAMRAEDWSVPPIVRMTNVNLEPSDATLEQLLRGIRHGYLLSTNKSWSIDDRRLNFQFTTEIAWEIKNGRVGRVVKNPLYTGITPEFWGRCSGVAGRQAWRLWGVTNCGKGEPMQSMHVGHGASPARFERVQIGSGRS